MTRLRGIWRQPKVQLLMLLLALATVGGWRQPRPELVVIQLLVAVGAAVLAEWAFFGTVASSFIKSASITGMLVGMILAPTANLKVVWFAAVLAIASKRLVVPDGKKHLFNPALFGLVLSIVLFGNQLTWWGSSTSIVIILGAGFILFRLNRLALPLSYFVTRSLAGAIFGQTSLGIDMFLLPNIFFAFIMVVEPKTSPAKRSAQWVFGAVCGIAATAFYQWLPAFGGDLLGLMLANTVRPTLEKATDRLVHGFQRRAEGVSV